MLRTFATAIFCFITLASVAKAEPPVKAENADQVSLSYRLMKDGVLIENGVTISGPYPATNKFGDTVGHAQLSCGNGQQSLKTVLLFDGFTLEHRVKGKDVLVNLTKFGIADRDEDIRRLAPGECRDMAPMQTVAFQKALRLPIDTKEVTTVPLGNGYSLRYQVFPPIIGRPN